MHRKASGCCYMAALSALLQGHFFKNILEMFDIYFFCSHGMAQVCRDAAGSGTHQWPLGSWWPRDFARAAGGQLFRTNRTTLTTKSVTVSTKLIVSYSILEIP